MDKNWKRLEQFVPVVEKVHGGSHPEFYDVRKVFDDISEKVKEIGTTKPDLDGEFLQLREMTNEYTVPAGVCESYAAVYEMLAELDEGYRS